MEAKELRSGAWIVHSGEPYQIKKTEVVVYGTHSHSKTKLFIKSLAGSEKILTLAHHDHVETTDIIRKSANVIAKLQNKIQIMDNQSYETFDAELQKELFDELNEGDNVTFIDFNGRISVLGKRAN